MMKVTWSLVGCILAMYLYLENKADMVRIDSQQGLNLGRQRELLPFAVKRIIFSNAASKHHRFCFGEQALCFQLVQGRVERYLSPISNVPSDGSFTRWVISLHVHLPIVLRDF